MIIFIVKHRTDDKDACRVLSSKSQKAIRGKHLSQNDTRYNTKIYEKED